MDNLLSFLLWGVVAIAIIIFVGSIMIGHATSYRFLSEGHDLVVANGQYLISKLSKTVL